MSNHFHHYQLPFTRATGLSLTQASVLKVERESQSVSSKIYNLRFHFWLPDFKKTFFIKHVVFSTFPVVLKGSGAEQISLVYLSINSMWYI